MCDFYCALPFTHLNVGCVRMAPCCSGYTKAAISYLPEEAVAVWNKPELQRVREGVLNGSFDMCLDCPYYNSNQSLGEQHPDHEPVMSHGPRFLTFSNDPRCNLHCFMCTCSAGVRKYTKEFSRTAPGVQQAMLKAFREDLRILGLSYVGDPFGTPSYRDLLLNLKLKDFPKMRLQLHTNGILLPKYWGRIEHCAAGAVQLLTVSVNAGAKGSYERIQQGAKWDQLIETLDFVATKREQHQFDFKLKMLMISWNIEEVPRFMQLAERYGATPHLQPLRKFDILFSGEEYRELAIHLPSHPLHGRMVELVAQAEESGAEVLLVRHPIRDARGGDENQCRGSVPE